MSIKGFSQEKVHRKSTQRRDGSGELDVFEATSYFSGCNEAAGYNANLFSQKELREERQTLGGRRMSLDMPSSASLPSQSHRVEKQTKEKKYKQPSSPGGKLASFLNSLFNQAASKKKKSKSMKDEEEIPGGGRRKRRSSISLFQNIGNNDSRSLYASSTASGFRTPPAYIDTPTKAYKDPKGYSDHKYVVSLPKYTGKVNSVSSQDEAVDEKKNMDLSWLDEKFRFIDEFSEKDKNMFKTDRIYVDKFDKFSSEKNNFVKKQAVVDHEVDDGAESDSSSDLFELGNYNLGSYPNDLPVYETTHMERIKRGPPITNGLL
ncbi:hypothetical protein AQUCO_00200903v1 [Aquilegia coerulea]|uniref:Protein BIG GRAIN 1-like E n=1 Tax=Aquilegia coerulea TaxID=218851 RepID=A0A2G5F5A8_AQUCA|nr:hypothetical protein AQUCO_00200903v1 [Aquilegia coerulea]